MIKSDLFFTDKYQKIQEEIRKFINLQKSFLSPQTISSPRAVGDAVQSILSENLESILGRDAKNYSASFARRAMADLAFHDKANFYYVVDVKTHRLDTHFNMPNLISVERLARFYEDDKNYFVILEMGYSVNDTAIVVEHVRFIPIEFLSWKCLTIGALGWGQIQISDSNRIVIIPSNSRKKWMLELCDRLFEFYPTEIDKIGERIDYFKRVRKYWINKK